MKIRTLKYSRIKQSEAVIVLCGGPSVTNNADRINEYVRKYNAVVFGSNYSFDCIGIKSDYTYIANDFKLHENIKKINNEVIIPAKVFSGEFPPEDTRKLLKAHPYKIYQAGIKANPTTYTIKKGIVKILSDGQIQYSRLSSAGHGCMLVSLLCRPQRMLLVGLDGPTDNTFKEKIMFDGRVQKYGKPQKHENFKNHFVNVIVPTVQHHVVQIETFEDVGIYQLDKNKLGINII